MVLLVISNSSLISYIVIYLRVWCNACRSNFLVRLAIGVYMKVMVQGLVKSAAASIAVKSKQGRQDKTRENRKGRHNTRHDKERQDYTRQHTTSQNNRTEELKNKVMRRVGKNRERSEEKTKQ
jgi:hypothetical protein